MIKPGKKRDWFIADSDTTAPLIEVPGINVVRSLRHVDPDVGPMPFEIHRSHLPLLESDEAWRLLAATIQKQTWAERDAHTDPLGFKLRSHQQTAIDFIRARRGTLLGDEMRVGKTISAAYSHEPAMGKLVVIAPLNTRMVWLKWFARVWPDTPVGIMLGKKFIPEEAAKPIVFGHYDILFHWQSGDHIGTLILDEAHWLTNHRSRRSMAATMLASRAERVIAATGTPIWNMPTGLWSVLGLVAPGAWGDYHEFCRRYAAPVPTPYGNKYTGISNGEELSIRMTEVMIRRRWVDVQADLPPITRNVVIVDLDDKKRRRLDIQAESMRESAKTNTAASLARYRDALSLIKLHATVDEAVACMQAGEPVVIWTWHRDLAAKVQQALIERGFEAFLMSGDTPPDRREQTIDAWRASLNAAFVVTMAVGQVGIDLSHSHRTIFAEIDYIPPMIAQAEMRTFSPMHSMNATYIVADHFIDRKIAMALTRKLDAATPLDLGMGEGVISAIDRAFRGPEETADLQRFMDDLLAS